MGMGGMNGGGCGGVHGVGWVVCRGMKGMCREMQLGGGVEEVSSVEGRWFQKPLTWSGVLLCVDVKMLNDHPECVICLTEEDMKLSC